MAACCKAQGRAFPASMNLIRAQKAFASQDVLVVEIIELGWGGKVQGEEVVVTARAGAPLPQLCSGNNVNDIEALALELGDDGGEGVVGGWDVVVGALDACTKRVPPAKWHIPVRATNLRIRVQKKSSILDGGMYQGSGVTGCEGEDVSAGDCAWAGRLKSGLDLVNNLKPPKGVLVGVGPFLTDYAATVIQQHGCITALHVEQCWQRLEGYLHQTGIRIPAFGGQKYYDAVQQHAFFAQASYQEGTDCLASPASTHASDQVKRDV
ncbi:hypothetical protein U9M48_020253 [Paspalum notatum var. saurae]|uniref:Uncharacterized protein n=1 Tax=Paspalum notatum var. saurae TaxID=547442 RepID=A0AAQ3TEE8_PASNO